VDGNDLHGSGIGPNDDDEIWVLALIDADELGESAEEVAGRLGRTRGVRPIAVGAVTDFDRVVRIVRAGAVDFAARDAGGAYLKSLPARLRAAERHLREGGGDFAERFMKIMRSLQHDIKNPVNNILGFVELLLTYSKDPLAEDQRDFLTRIHANSEHVLQILDAFAEAAARLTGGK
jgi:signal transduction histidine kinase